LNTGRTAASFDHVPLAKFRSPAVNASPAPQITLYTSAICGYCVAAKNFLKSRGLSWNEVRIDTDPAEREKMVARARRTSVPQIFIGDTHVGGYDDMMALHRAGKLEPLLEGQAP
jgi:glutaredoxin 3